MVVVYRGADANGVPEMGSGRVGRLDLLDDVRGVGRGGDDDIGGGRVEVYGVGVV